MNIKEIDRIRRKIRKLYALSKSPNKEEADSALKKAQKLKTEYKINELNNDYDSRIKEKEIINIKEIKKWLIELIICVTEYTNCDLLIKEYENNIKIMIIGEMDNIRKCENKYKYIYTKVIKTSEKYRIVVKDTDSFRLGMIESIKFNLTNKTKDYKIDTNTTEIIINNEYLEENNMKYINDKYKKIKNIEYFEGIEENSYGLGKIIGKKIKIEELNEIEDK